MSGASALAAAKRRRSKNDQINNQNLKTNSVNTQNPNNPQSNINLSVKDSFYYLMNRIVMCEKNQELMNNQIQSLNPSPQQFNEITTQIQTIQQRLNQLQDLPTTGNQLPKQVDNESTYVEVSQFNNVMGQIANDMTEVSSQINQFKDLFLTIQNNYLVLKNDIAKLETQPNLTMEVREMETIPEEDSPSEESDDNNSPVEDNNDSKEGEEGAEEAEEAEGEEAEGEEAEGEEAEVEEAEGEEAEGAAENENNEVSTVDILNSLKKLNATDIKEEVAKEFTSSKDSKLTKVHIEEEA